MASLEAKKIISQIYFNVLKKFSLRTRLKLEFLRKHRRFLNLDCPSSYSEKIAWRKLVDRDPRLPYWSDKVKVKEIVAKEVGEKYLLPNLWVGKDPREIPLEELPRPYVIKTSNGSGVNIFVHEHQQIVTKIIREKVSANLNNQFFQHTDEWPYSHIEPRIIAEPIMLDFYRRLPVDYKFHVFGGKAAFIQVDVGRFKNHSRVFYGTSWNRQSFSLYYPLMKEEHPRPFVLEEMINVAEKLGRNFHYVRIDLYDFMNSVVFGEATFFPGAGYLRFNPSQIDSQWGALWDLSYQ